MSNIITFRPKPKPTRASTFGALAACVMHRRSQNDVYWLKENAELLNLMVALQSREVEGVLPLYAAFYDGIEDRLRFYPQYYRFFLSMCLDLEDLGMAGRKGQALCDWAAYEGLVETELSDLQRAEARRLLNRRGAAPAVGQGDLGGRLRRFVDRAETFAVPNRKAAYELTHVIFYLSDYGHRDPGLGTQARLSLEYAGLLAFLDRDHDLLAEVCCAIRFCGGRPSPLWEAEVASAHRQIAPLESIGAGTGADGYHAYLVTGWAAAVAERDSFAVTLPDPCAGFTDPRPRSGALRALSVGLLELGKARRGQWGRMRGRLMSGLPQGCRDLLEQAEQSSPHFGSFFEGFARAARP